MRTFEQQLQEAVGANYPLDVILANLSTDEILEEVNIFDKEVAKEALKNASENALILNKFGNDIGSFAFDENSNKIWINKQSILNESNIPKL